jgi:hypothetical protein
MKKLFTAGLLAAALVAAPALGAATASADASFCDVNKDGTADVVISGPTTLGVSVDVVMSLSYGKLLTFYAQNAWVSQEGPGFCEVQLDDDGDGTSDRQVILGDVNGDGDFGDLEDVVQMRKVAEPLGDAIRPSHGR